MTCGIYKITNKINGKMYIGQSVHIEKRWKEHKHDSKTKSNHLCSSIRNYGLENFEFSIIVECDEHMLDEFEMGIIKLYGTFDRTKGYNKTFGGEGGKHNEETKNKLSKANKGKTLTKEHKKKISEGGKGLKRSEETKRNMSKARKGIPTQSPTKETRLKMSESRKCNTNRLGTIHSEETKKKISEGGKGLKRSEETKRKISEARKLYWSNKKNV